MVVTFFGHANTNENIKEKLEEVLINLIENKNATSFIFGNNGSFDAIVKSTVKELKTKYPNIAYSVVLAYLPQKSEKSDFNDYSDTVYPEKVAKAPKKFAIVYRNRWMIEKSDIVVVYVKQRRSIRTRLKRQYLGAFWIIGGGRRQPYHLHCTKNHTKFFSF